ncbi:MAG TPA: hypothetical protein VMB48_03395, partial [Steroidobacteraceae bacterium]|nr:hypothetical protein [Steroidobacteraceae bacterium]
MELRSQLPARSVLAEPVYDLSAEPMPLTAAPQEGLSLAQVLAIVRAHWRRSAAICACLVCVTAVVLKLMPRTYTATATLIVD